MMHLQDSLGNLNLVGDNGIDKYSSSLENNVENRSESQSRPITPKPFNCRVTKSVKTSFRIKYFYFQTFNEALNYFICGKVYIF